MKQRIIIGGVCLALTMSLVGCGGQTAQEPQEPQEPKQEVQQAEPVSMETLSSPIKSEAEAAPEDMNPVEVHEEEAADEAVDEAADESAADPFTEANETVYATGTVNIRASWSASSDKIGSLGTGDSVTRIGIGSEDAEGWSRVQLSDGSTAYISNKYLSTTKPVTANNGGGSTQTAPSTSHLPGGGDFIPGPGYYPPGTSPDELRDWSEYVSSEGYQSTFEEIVEGWQSIR